MKAKEIIQYLIEGYEIVDIFYTTRNFQYLTHPNHSSKSITQRQFGKLQRDKVIKLKRMDLSGQTKHYYGIVTKKTYDPAE
jgi:hypothetical protein